MPRSLLVGVLVFGLLVDGCAGRQYVSPSMDAPAESVNWDPPPMKSKHPVLDWCGEHPVMAGAATAVLVAGGILFAGAALFAYEFRNVH